MPRVLRSSHSQFHPVTPRKGSPPHSFIYLFIWPKDTRSFIFYRWYIFSWVVPAKRPRKKRMPGRTVSCLSANEIHPDTKDSPIVATFLLKPETLLLLKSLTEADMSGGSLPSQLLLGSARGICACAAKDVCFFRQSFRTYKSDRDHSYQLQTLISNGLDLSVHHPSLRKPFRDLLELHRRFRQNSETVASHQEKRTLVSHSI